MASVETQEEALNANVIVDLFQLVQRKPVEVN